MAPFFMADLKRWGNPNNYHADWQERGRIVARYLAGCRRVADFGAGTHALQPMLTGAEYLPIDVVSLKPGTVVVDLDSDWNTGIAADCDGIAVAGLLEHLADPTRFLWQIAGIGQTWAVTYMDAAKHRHKLLTVAELECCFRAAGMAITDRARWHNQNIYRLARR